MKKTTCRTERKIGNTLFIVTEECSPTARETIDEKLLKIMKRHIFDFEKPLENGLQCGLK